jgi:hypothetical protein
VLKEGVIHSGQAHRSDSRAVPSIKQLLGEKAAGIVQNGYVGEGSDTTSGDKEKLHSGVIVSAMGHLDATSGGSH